MLHNNQFNGLAMSKFILEFFMNTRTMSPKALPDDLVTIMENS